MFFKEDTEGSSNPFQQSKKSYEWGFVRLFALSLSNIRIKLFFYKKY